MASTHSTFGGSVGGPESEEPTHSMAADGQSATTDDTPALIGPLYITVGPPCAGKTTWLKQQVGDIADISLDVQPGVYHSVPTEWFLDAPPPLQNQSRNLTHSTAPSHNVSAKLHGKSIQDRIWSADQAELRTVLARMAGRVSRDVCGRGLATCIRDPIVRQALVDALEEMMQQSSSTSAAHGSIVDAASITTSMQLPSTVDVFVREALFSGRPNAIERTEGLLWDAALGRSKDTLTQQNGAKSQPMAWGNTNTIASDYQTALSVAAASQRPVHFVVYHDPDMPTGIYPTALIVSTSSDATASVDSLFDLTASSFADLLRRSLRRLQLTGRYVPAGVVWDKRAKTATLIQKAVEEAYKARKGRRQGHQPDNETGKDDAAATVMTSSDLTPLSKLELHQGLARLINFEMADSRLVSACSEPPPRRGQEANGNRSNHHSHDQRSWTLNGGRGGRNNADSPHDRKRPWDRKHNGGGHHPDNRRMNGNGHGVSRPPTPPPPTGHANHSNRRDAGHWPNSAQHRPDHGPLATAPFGNYSQAEQSRDGTSRLSSPSNGRGWQTAGRNDRRDERRGGGGPTRR